MRDWCSECQFANYGGSQEPCYNCVTAYNKKPSEFTPATDEVRGVAKVKYEHGDYSCSACGHPARRLSFARKNYCDECGAKLLWEVSDDA